MDISKIHINPKNPRIIKDGKFEKLCRSIQEFPKMLELRPIVVDPNGMILGGNMRFKALQHLKMDIKPEWVKQADSLTDEEVKRFIVEDNVGFGEWDWDQLANEYDKEELEEWGLDVDNWDQEYGEEFSLPDGDKTPFQQMTFTLADEQAELISDALAKAKNLNLETYDNENSNGNALYWIAKQWMSKK
jgi:hypothetical protein